MDVNAPDFFRIFRETDNIVSYPAETVIFREGEPGDCMYIIISGQARIEVKGKYLDTVGEGGIIGEMALLDDSPRSATAVTIAPCQLLPVDEERFLYLVEKRPAFAIDVMRVLADRLRGMNEML